MARARAGRVGDSAALLSSAMCLQLAHVLWGLGVMPHHLLCSNMFIRRCRSTWQLVALAVALR